MMKKIIVIFILAIYTQCAFAQGFGIVRKNYFTTYFDTLSGISYEELVTSSIRLGSINPTTGLVSNVGSTELYMGINLSGATIDPYSEYYYISSGYNLLTFDMTSGALINTASISGPFATAAFQNYRLNPSDTTIYGFIPNNVYITYFDSLTFTMIEELVSSDIRFAKINPMTGDYSLVGSTPLKNIYTLAGNSIDPHQMLFYYSAVDTLVALDLYTGEIYSETPLSLPPNAIFENFTYSCVDTSIYGLVRQNFISTVYDSILMMYIEVYDSSTVKLCKINPNVGTLTMISPSSIGLGSNLSGSCYIDPNTMTYYFSSGSNIIGVSLATGLITSNQVKTFESGSMYLDMMRNKDNCLGAIRVRQANGTSFLNEAETNANFNLEPNPTQNFVTMKSNKILKQLALIDLNGKVLLYTNANILDVSAYANGAYFVKGTFVDGTFQIQKLIKN